MRAPALLALLLIGSAQAADPPRPGPLGGELFLGGATLVDPPPGEATDTHAYVAITGASARRMFEAMPGPVVRDACRPERRSKVSGNLVCSVGRRAVEARCSFGIALRSGETSPGPPC